MTYEEVKQIRQNHPEKGVDNLQVSELIDFAVDKQIAEKPIGNQCPECCAVVDGENYCPNCGQKLRWK